MLDRASGSPLPATGTGLSLGDMMDFARSRVLATTLSMVFLVAPAAMADSLYDYPLSVRDTSSVESTARPLECAGGPCPRIRTTIYGIDAGGTVETFAFDTGVSSSVPTPGDVPEGGPEGLAVAAEDEAFWVSAFGFDEIFEFDPRDGRLIE